MPKTNNSSKPQNFLPIDKKFNIAGPTKRSLQDRLPPGQRQESNDKERKGGEGKKKNKRPKPIKWWDKGWKMEEEPATTTKATFIFTPDFTPCPLDVKDAATSDEGSIPPAFTTCPSGGGECTTPNFAPLPLDMRDTTLEGRAQTTLPALLSPIPSPKFLGSRSTPTRMKNRHSARKPRFRDWLKENIAQYQAVWGYDARRTDELSLIRGEIVIAYPSAECYWLVATNAHGMTGLIPETHIRARGP